MKVTIKLLELCRPFGNDPVDTICVNGNIEQVYPYCDLDHDPWVSITRARLNDNNDAISTYTLSGKAAHRFMLVLSLVYPDTENLDTLSTYISNPSDINKLCSRIVWDGGDDLAVLLPLSAKITLKSKSLGKLCDYYAIVIIPEED